MNARYLILGSTAALALLVGALLLARDGEKPPPDVGETAPRVVPAPAAGTLAVAPGTTSPVPEAEEPRPAPAAERSGDPERPGPPERDPGPAPSPAPERAQPERGSSERASPKPGSGEAAPDSTKEAILRATSRAYEGLRSIRAEFEQELENVLLGRTTHSAGTLYQRHPDRFLMAFSDPAGDVIVSDGEWFWMYYPSVDPKQVMRTARGAQGLDLKSQFIGDPVARFESIYHGREPVRGRTAHVLTLVPRDSRGYSRLKVWVDAADHLVRRFELTEDTGNVRHFELLDMVVNPALPDTLFEFTPPAGAEVVTR